MLEHSKNMKVRFIIFFILYDINEHSFLKDSLEVPRFSFMVPVAKSIECSDYVEFVTNERVQRMILWIKDNFLISNELSPKSTELDLAFKSSSQVLNVKMQSGRVIIETRGIKFASEIIQSLGSYVGVCHFSSNLTPNDTIT